MSRDRDGIRRMVQFPAQLQNEGIDSTLGLTRRRLQPGVAHRFESKPVSDTRPDARSSCRRVDYASGATRTEDHAPFHAVSIQLVGVQADLHINDRAYRADGPGDERVADFLRVDRPEPPTER